MNLSQICSQHGAAVLKCVPWSQCVTVIYLHDMPSQHRLKSPSKKWLAGAEPYTVKDALVA